MGVFLDSTTFAGRFGSVQLNTEEGVLYLSSMHLTVALLVSNLENSSFKTS